MSITDTTPRSPRRRKPRQRPAALLQRRKRQRRAIDRSDLVLHALMRDGDLFDVDDRKFFVSPISDDELEELIAAIGAMEDDEDSDNDRNSGDEEPDADDEPDHDRERDRCDDEPSLCGTHAGMQPGISDRDLESDEVDDEGGEPPDYAEH